MAAAALPTKRCTKCGEEKSLVAFGRDRQNSDGLMHRCRDCTNAFARRNYEKRGKTFAACDAPPTKKCVTCHEEKPSSEFWKSPKNADGLATQCRVCVSAYHKRHYERYQRIARSHSYKRLYGISIEEYERRLTAQGGVCAVCGSCRPGAGRRYFAVDHDHKTGQIRGLLCNKCNPALGLMDDDPERLKAATQYLRRFIDGCNA